MIYKNIPRKKRRQRPRFGLARRPCRYSQIALEEAGIETFEIGDGSELDWDDPDVGYRWNMLNDHS